MEILVCPVKGCSKYDFGVPNPEQSHVNEHLKKDHGIASLGPIKDLCKRPTKIWKACRDTVQDQIDEKLHNRNVQFLRFMSNPSKDIPNKEPNCNYLHEEWAKLMEAHDDEKSDSDTTSEINSDESNTEDERTATRVRKSRKKLTLAPKGRKPANYGNENESSVEEDLGAETYGTTEHSEGEDIHDDQAIDSDNDEQE